MSLNWVNSLDMLAKEGVLNYDAPAFVLGQPPRYTGSPSITTPVQPIADMPVMNKSQPQTDKFTPSNDKNYVKNPAWKKILFAAIAIAGIVLCRNKIANVFKKAKTSNLKKYLSSKCDKVIEFFKNIWTKIVNVFKKKK